jgi:hypothetical protein
MVPCVVVPILNRPDLLDRCLKSIDYPVETLIVVDNGGVYDADMMSWVVDRQLVKNSYVWSFPSNLGVAHHGILESKQLLMLMVGFC